jgi:outer membrane protein
MKNLLFAAFLTGFSVFGLTGSASAQSKIGYINYEEVVAAMPETEVANKELQEFQESLAKQGEDLEKEANEKSSQFVKDSASLTQSMKDIKRDEIIKLIQRVQNYNTEAQEKVKQTAQQKFAPIQQKATEAINAVAKEKGFAYILDQNNLLVMPPDGNIIQFVKAKLGIKESTVPAQKPGVNKANK